MEICKSFTKGQDWFIKVGNIIHQIGCPTTGDDRVIAFIGENHFFTPIRFRTETLLHMLSDSFNIVKENNKYSIFGYKTNKSLNNMPDTIMMYKPIWEVISYLRSVKATKSYDEDFLILFKEILEVDNFYSFLEAVYSKGVDQMKGFW